MWVDIPEQMSLSDCGSESEVQAQTRLKSRSNFCKIRMTWSLSARSIGAHFNGGPPSIPGADQVNLAREEKIMAY